MMDKNSKIYIAGHDGMVGANMMSLLEQEGYNNIIGTGINEIDLRDQQKVDEFFLKEKPEYVFLFAARVGGIQANISAPAEFLYDNIMIESNVIHSSYKYKVKKLLFLGSSCVYPRESAQPMKEECLLTGKLEPTNEGYALAKIVGLKLCEYYNNQYGTNYIALMPPNLYGIGDNFSSKNSHVMAALIKKFYAAKEDNTDYVEIWGTGKARREFMYVKDVVNACLHFMNKYDQDSLPPVLNVGTGGDVSILELVNIVKQIVGYSGEIKLDTTKPDGMPRKQVDVTKMKEFGWCPNYTLSEGISETYDWYLSKQ
jgi:GDP-L-fucose synthase